jgi:hypothetical protein
MDYERLLDLAGIDGIDSTNKRANRLAREILVSATPLVERTHDVLQNLDPVKDKLIRETVVNNLLRAIKQQLL